MPDIDERSRVKLALDLHSAWQERFEIHRTERVRKGKRWQTRDVIDYRWSECGITHLRCVMIGEWKKKEFRFWVALEIPLRPEPENFLGYDQIRAIVRSHGPAIFEALKSERHWNLAIRPSIRLPGTPSNEGTDAAAEWEVSSTVAATLDDWIAKLSACEAQFDRAKQYLLTTVTEHSSYYEDVTSQLRVAARFIDRVEACDASPHLGYLDHFPSRIDEHLTAFLARKQTWNHGFKVAFQTFHDRVYAASFPEVWKGQIIAF